MMCEEPNRVEMLNSVILTEQTDGHLYHSAKKIVVPIAILENQSAPIHLGLPQLSGLSISVNEDGTIDLLDKLDVPQCECECCSEEVEDKSFVPNSENKSLMQKMEKLAEEYADIFGCVDEVPSKLAQFEIKLSSNDKPITQPMRSLEPAKAKWVVTEIQRLLKLGIIRKSTSEWASPLVVVGKRTAPFFCMCVDYSEDLNKRTVKDCFPLPNPEDLFPKFQGKKFFSSYDFVGGYPQVVIKEEY